MQWQDWIFTLGQAIFVIALIPTIKGKSKPALSTSLATGAILITFALSYFSLQLWFSTIASIVISGAWFLLAYQKYQQIKKK